MKNISILLFTTIILSGCNQKTATDQERDWSAYPMETGAFEGTWESLENYEVPEWFRDAKLGFWSIIGPQAVPLQGDWYARHMYVEGHRQNKYHVEHYGHPSEFGYKDLIEKFNPTELNYDELVGLYKKAGGKYAVILAVHHDNFDLWNSKHHEWNSVNKGPKRDLVGEFRDAALKHDLRFGVTTHLARSYSWLQTSHGADKEGPFKGIHYDGANQKHQALYHAPFQEDLRYPVNPPDAWKQNWYLRVQDLIDQYQPDLMYFDGGYPFDENVEKVKLDEGAVGRRLVSHYYNASMKWNNGHNEAAMAIKKRVKTPSGFRDGTCIQDIERGMAADILEIPWQTDDCIGGWYYKSDIQYKTVEKVIHMLIDIVSKNGNLLLNIPLHPDGFIDEQEKNILKEMGNWMDINGSALYGTRPWTVFGEGPTNVEGGDFNKQKLIYTPNDFRFTVKADTVFAFCMAWPASLSINIRSIKPIDDSEIWMLGHDTPLDWNYTTTTGLSINLPKEFQKKENRPCKYAFALKIKTQK